MNENSGETQDITWQESHPWLTCSDVPEEEDSIGEVIRYSLDEMRL